MPATRSRMGGHAMAGGHARAATGARHALDQLRRRCGLCAVEAVRLVDGLRRPGAQVFPRAGLPAIAGGIAPALIVIGGAAWRSRAQSFKTTCGSARWADLSDVRHAGLLARRGVVLGLFDDSYLRHDGPEHVLAVAPTRSGKGVGLVVPTLLTWTGSAVIHDIKGRELAAHSGMVS
jgi:type IV secretory pathway TraG/TraD family ATPase VirD4